MFGDKLISSILIYIFEKMQRYTVYFIWKLLHVSGGTITHH